VEEEAPTNEERVGIKATSPRPRPSQSREEDNVMKYLLLPLLALVLVAAATAEPLLGLLAKAAFIKGAIIGSQFGRGGGGYYGRRRFGGGRRRGGFRRRYSGYRWKRDIDEEEEINKLIEQEEDLIGQASAADTDDCLKNLLCVAAAQPKPDALETLLLAGAGGLDEDGSFSVDPSSAGARFQLAAAVGASGGLDACVQTYPLCQRAYREVKEEVAQARNQVPDEQF